MAVSVQVRGGCPPASYSPIPISPTKSIPKAPLVEEMLEPSVLRQTTARLREQFASSFSRPSVT